MLRLAPFALLLLLPLLIFSLSACGGPDAHGSDSPDRAEDVRRFRFEYRAWVEEVPEDASRLRLWVPVPLEGPEQTVGDVRVDVTIGEETRTWALDELPPRDTIGGAAVAFVAAPIDHGRGRSLCVETQGVALALEVRSDVTRREARAGGTATPEDLERALAADALIPLDGRAAAVAAGLGDGDDPFDLARRLYDHTLDRMHYDKPEGGDWGRGDAEWACDSRYGNCTDFHSYFIALARARGIPARFEMGFPVPAADGTRAPVGGYHCWAFFHVADRGWVPVDISEADKHPERAEFFFGHLDADRVTMTEGRDLLLEPRPAAGALNFFVYPYAEVDGRPWSEVGRAFSRVDL